jgi:hypothetical protein
LRLRRRSIRPGRRASRRIPVSVVFADADLALQQFLKQARIDVIRHVTGLFWKGASILAVMPRRCRSLAAHLARLSQLAAEIGVSTAKNAKNASPIKARARKRQRSEDHVAFHVAYLF